VYSVCDWMRTERSGVEFPAEARDFPVSKTVQSEPESIQSLIQPVAGPLPCDKVDRWGGGVKLTSRPHIIPGLTRNGAIPLLPVYSYIIETGICM
jgi:hypothetical protein